MASASKGVLLMLLILLLLLLLRLLHVMTAGYGLISHVKLLFQNRHTLQRLSSNFCVNICLFAVNSLWTNPMAEEYFNW